MLNVLIRKQLTELKYVYFKQKKTGEPLDKKSFISRALLLGVLYLILALSFFVFGAAIADAATESGINWLYFAMMGSISFAFTAFTNLFFAYSNLYSAKDNELLLSMPVKVRDIVLSRLLVHYINCLIYESLVYLPMMVAYMIFDFSFRILVLMIIGFFVTGLYALAIANVIGFIIAKIAKYFKNRAYITFALTMIFFIGYEYLAINLNRYLDRMLDNIDNIAVMFYTKLGIFYMFGDGIKGNILNFILYTVIAVMLTCLCAVFVEKIFVKTVISSSKDIVRKYDRKVSKKNSVYSALIKRELKKFTSNATYLMNNGLGIALLIILGVLSFFFKTEIKMILMELTFIFGEASGNIAGIGIVLFIVTIISMNCLATPSVSLEGNSYWLIRSLPVSSKDVLNSKMYLEFILNTISGVFATVCLCFSMEVNPGLMPIVTMLTVIISYFMANFHLMIGVLCARLDFTNETVVIKQSWGVLVDIFGGFIMAFGLGFLWYSMSGKISTEMYLMIVLAVLAISGKLINGWINTTGSKLFEKLG